MSESSPYVLFWYSYQNDHLFGMGDLVDTFETITQAEDHLRQNFSSGSHSLHAARVAAFVNGKFETVYFYQLHNRSILPDGSTGEPYLTRNRWVKCVLGEFIWEEL